MFSISKRYLRRIQYTIKAIIKPSIFWLFFMTYRALDRFPRKQKKFLHLFSKYPGFQQHLDNRHEKNLVFPYIPMRSQDLSMKARQIYDAFQKNNNQDLR